MSESVITVREIRLRREGTRVYVLLKDGETWVRAEVTDPVAFFREGYRMALAAKQERMLLAQRRKGLIR